MKTKTERAMLAFAAEPKIELKYLRREQEAEDMSPDGFNTRFDDFLFQQYEAARDRIEKAELEIRKAKRVVAELADYTWAARGDDEAVDWNDAATRADYLMRFAAWLEGHPAIFIQWQAAGLTFEDLFERA